MPGLDERLKERWDHVRQAVKARWGDSFGIGDLGDEAQSHDALCSLIGERCNLDLAEVRQEINRLLDDAEAGAPGGFVQVPQAGAGVLLPESDQLTDASGIIVHETAEVHPSVVLEGAVVVGAYSKIGAGTVIIGNVSIGHHTLIECNVVIRGRNAIGNYVHIYDLVNIEGGRPGGVGGVINEEPDQSVIGDHCWVNHGSTMHGSQLAEGAVVGVNACLDYNCRVGRDALVANGTSCRLNTVIPDNSLVEGVPGQVVKEDITDDDRREIMGLVPRRWIDYWAEQREALVREQTQI